MKPIQQLSKLQPKNIDSIDLSWVNIWNDEIANDQFCLISFYNVKEYLTEKDLNWCQILITNALPSAIGKNLCDLLKINLEKHDQDNEDIITEMEIYRSISKEYWPEIDKLYQLTLDAKGNKTL